MLMRKLILLFLGVTFASCHTAKIKDEKYEVSGSTAEIGTIGMAKSNVFGSSYSIHAFPKLEKKIRVDVSIVPFDKKLNELYLKKNKYNQQLADMNYVDSVAVKPELVTISIMDKSGYIAELNSPMNKDVTNYLRNVKKAKVITGIAMTLSAENLAKLRSADSYYLANNQNKKYTLALYKSNKPTETIDLQSGTVLAYQLGKCCWLQDDREQWNVADITDNCHSCNGNMRSKVKDKESAKSLFRM